MEEIKKDLTRERFKEVLAKEDYYIKRIPELFNREVIVWEPKDDEEPYYLPVCYYEPNEFLSINNSCYLLEVIAQYNFSEMVDILYDCYLDNVEIQEFALKNEGREFENEQEKDDLDGEIFWNRLECLRDVLIMANLAAQDKPFIPVYDHLKSINEPTPDLVYTSRNRDCSKLIQKFWGNEIIIKNHLH